MGIADTTFYFVSGLNNVVEVFNVGINTECEGICYSFYELQKFKLWREGIME